MTAAAAMVGRSQIGAPEQDGMALGYTFLLWGGVKRTGTHRSPPFSALLLLPPLHRHQLLKFMATRWHLSATSGALRLQIASNTIK